MNLVYISHWRFPSEKTMSPLIMKTCSEFVRQGSNVELWIPWRHNPEFDDIDPFLYHGTENNFLIRRLPAIDWMRFIPGKLGMFLLLISFNVSVFFCALIHNYMRNRIFYVHFNRDVILLSLFACNIFLEIHDFYKSSLSILNKWTFLRARGFIVTNRIKIKNLEKDFGISKNIILHKPNAVDTKMFNIIVSKEEAREKLRLPKDKKIILYAGHLFGWKGVDTLLEAYKLLSSGSVIYFVGGVDEDIARMEAKSIKMDTNNVIFVGRKPHEEIPIWYRAADVLVLPNTAKDIVSKLETSPVKLFEYLASGRPIVASDIPSICDIVDDKSVWFFNPDDKESLAKTINGVLKEKPDILKNKSMYGRKLVSGNTWDRRIGSIIDFIKHARK